MTIIQLLTPKSSAHLNKEFSGEKLCYTANAMIALNLYRLRLVALSVCCK